MITRQQVPIEQRVRHTAALFGIHFPLMLEPAIYTFASRLSPDYRGGYWQFYSLSNGGFYIAPDEAAQYAVACENGFEGNLTADALGITVCLYAYSHLSFDDDAELAEVCARQYHLLREFAMNHAEVEAILAAID